MFGAGLDKAGIDPAAASERSRLGWESRQRAAKKPTVSEEPDLNFTTSYGKGETATAYAERVKPKLMEVARDLGYKVGSYSHRTSNPRTDLTPKDPASKVSRVFLYWHRGEGKVPQVEAYLRRKETPEDQKKRESLSGLGFLGPVMAGAPDGQARGNPKAKTLHEAVQSAIDAAMRDMESQQSQKALKKGEFEEAEHPRDPSGKFESMSVDEHEVAATEHKKLREGANRREDALRREAKTHLNAGRGKEFERVAARADREGERAQHHHSKGLAHDRAAKGDMKGAKESLSYGTGFRKDLSLDALSLGDALFPGWAKNMKLAPPDPLANQRNSGI